MSGWDFLNFKPEQLDELIEGSRGWEHFKSYYYRTFLKDEEGAYCTDENGCLILDPKAEKGVFYPEISGWVSTVAEYGGEGGGDEYWVVVMVTPDDPEVGAPRYFKKAGYYASYDGGYFDIPCFEVRPREKMITVYE